MEQLLPLAFTMMIGPQIITAIILVTAKDVIKPSLAYIAAVGFAATTGTLAFYILANLLGFAESSDDGPSTTALRIQTFLVLILIALTIKTFINRKTAELPGWMSKLQSATPRETAKIGLMLIYLMPSDLIIMSTVGINLASNPDSGVSFVPFILLTMLIAALPLLAYLIFRKRAVGLMPKVRSWMEQNSWVVSIAAYVVFIWLLWP